MKRKIISLLLCLVMALSLIPTVAFAKGEGPQIQTSVDHIDVLVALNINGQKESLDQDDLKNITITSTTSNFTVTARKLNGSTDAYGQKQARFEGSFPVGTKDNPVSYTLSLTKVVDGVSYDLTLTTDYWDENNFCPPTLKDQKNPLNGHNDTWTNGGVVPGSGIDVEFGTANASTRQVIITKNILGVDTADLVDGKTFTFTIYEEDGVTQVGSPLTAKTTAENPSSANAITYLVRGTYVVKETASADYDNYTLSGTTYSGVEGTSTFVVGDNGGSLTVTNTYEKIASDTTSITVTKKWVDDNNSLNKRPESVTVELLADDTKEREIVLTSTSTDEWTATFENLPINDNEGNLINYTVQEKPVPGYTPQVIEPGESVVTVGELTKVPNCNFTAFNTNGANLVIAKLTENEGYVVWTETQLTKDQEATLLVQVKAACDIPDNKTVVFISGNGVTHESNGETATFAVGTLSFTKTKMWSMFWYGNVTVSQPNNGFTIVNTLNIEEGELVPATLTIKKVDADNPNLTLSGAEFTLTNADGTLVGDKAQVTNEDGICTFSNLTEGYYELKETKAPEGYEKSNQTWTIKVTQNPDPTDIVLDKETNQFQKVYDCTVSKLVGNEYAPLTNGLMTITNEKEKPDSYTVTLPIKKIVDKKVGSDNPGETKFTFVATKYDEQTEKTTQYGLGTITTKWCGIKKVDILFSRIS